MPVAEKPNVRTAEAEPEAADEVFELDAVPDGVEIPGDPKVEGQPETEIPEEPKPEPRARQPKQAKPKEVDGLPASTRQERDKRKKYAELWEEAEREKEALEAQLRAARVSPTESRLTPEARAALKDKANKAETMGDLLDIAIDVIEQRNARVEHMVGEERFNRFLHVSEAFARNRWADYDKVLKAAGITDAVVTDNRGQFANPAIAHKIYNAKDPAAMAYELALGKLEKDGRLDEVRGDTEPAGDPDPEPADDKPAPKGKASASERSEERRAGAREVIEQVSGNSSKPRGLTALRPAAPPKKGVTRKELDRLADEDPNGLATLFKAQPRLKEWWLGGVDTP